MTAYEQVLDIARRQVIALEAGDVQTAAALLDERGRLIAAAPPTGPADEPVIRAILDHDRVIATAFRRRMIAIRDEVARLHHGQHALSGYGGATHSARVLNWLA